MDREPQFWIAQGQQVQGPFPLSRVRGWIAAGRARPEMLYSRDGGPWRPGPEHPELFPAPAAAVPPVARPVAPAAAPVAPVAPVVPVAPVAPVVPVAPVAPVAVPVARAAAAAPGRPGRRAGAGRTGRRPPRRAPGTVLAAQIIDFISGAANILWGVRLLHLASTARMRARLEGFGDDAVSEIALQQAISTANYIGWASILIGGGLIALGFWLGRGRPAARNVQLGLVGLALLAALWQLMEGVSAVVAVAGLVFPAIIACLLLGPRASDFFAGRPPREARRPGRRR